MTTEPHDRLDPELEVLLADVALAVEDELEQETGTPDLAAALALAARLDPDAVPTGWVEDSAGLAPVVPLQRGRRIRQTREDVELDAVVAQVRAAVDHEIAKELHGTPARASTPSASTPAPRRAWWVGLAAAAVLLVGGAAILQATLVQRVEPEPGHEAALSERTSSQHSRATHPSGASMASKRQPESQPEVPTDPETPTQPEAEGESAEESLARPSKRRRPRARPAPKPEPDAPSLEERLAQLDARAHQAWKAGDEATAREAFGEIIRIGGRHRLVDLAYGDLLTLARRAGDAGTEVTLWKAYLKRFPRGRFADDARAGLCRTARGDAQRSCWQRYLDEHPDGAYRSQARTALHEDPR